MSSLTLNLTEKVCNELSLCPDSENAAAVQAILENDVGEIPLSRFESLIKAVNQTGKSDWFYTRLTGKFYEWFETRQPNDMDEFCKMWIKVSTSEKLQAYGPRPWDYLCAIQSPLVDGTLRLWHLPSPIFLKSPESMKFVLSKDLSSNHYPIVNIAMGIDWKLALDCIWLKFVSINYKHVFEYQRCLYHTSKVERLILELYMRRIPPEDARAMLYCNPGLDRDDMSSINRARDCLHRQRIASVLQEMGIYSGISREIADFCQTVETMT